MFWNNYVRLCDEIGKKPNAVAAELGLSSGSVSAWKQGRLPRGNTIAMIAQYFGVKPSELLQEHSTPQPIQESPEKNQDTAEIADICDKLAQTKAGKARLQFLLEEAQRLLEETEAYEQKRKNLDTK